MKSNREMTSNSRSSNSGVVVSVRGSVVDMRFDGQLPPIYSLLRAGRENRSSSKCWRNWMRVACAALR